MCFVRTFLAIVVNNFGQRISLTVMRNPPRVSSTSFVSFALLDSNTNVTNKRQLFVQSNYKDQFLIYSLLNRCTNSCKVKLSILWLACEASYPSLWGISCRIERRNGSLNAEYFGISPVDSNNLFARNFTVYIRIRGIWVKSVKMHSEVSIV